MWVFFSIAAAFLWAFVNTADKYILTKWIKSPQVPLIVAGVVGLVWAIIVYFAYGFAPLSGFNIFLALVVGLLFILMAVFYFKAVKIEEVSRVVPLFYLSPLFISVFAGIFLGEIFTTLKYLGIFLLIIGAVLISSRNILKITFGRAFWLMMLSVIFLSASQLLTKYLLNFTDYWTIFAWARVGAIVGVIPIVYVYLPELIEAVRKHGKKIIVVISANEAITLLGTLFITIAASIGYVTLVNALASVQPFFVLMITVILSIFYPAIINEEVGKSVILQKLLAIILMFTGALLIT